MGGSYCLLELNEHADRITAYLYIEKAVAVHLGSYMESERASEGQGACLETSLKSINKEELWLEVRGVTSKEKGVPKDLVGSEDAATSEQSDKTDPESSSDLRIVLKLPDRLRVQDVLSVSYYRDSISGIMSEKAGPGTQGAVSPVMFSRVVLSLKSKLSMLTISTLVSGVGWDQQYDLPVIEKDETICLDLEIGSLSRLAEGSAMRRDGQCRLCIQCKGCGGLVSEYSKNWTTAPLPSEMFIHGSEMLTCDNCCPVFSENSGPSRCARSFGARKGWICLGQYHISIHMSDALQDHLLVGEEPGFEKTLEAFFIADINNIYYSSQKAFWSISCQHCGAHLGWRNYQDSHINLWKSKVLLNAFSGDEMVLSLFSNYPATSLVAHYIEKHLRKDSRLYIAESNGCGDAGLLDAESYPGLNGKELLSVYILKKNVIKLKTQLFAGLSYDEIESQIHLCRKRRPVLYNIIKISYESDNVHIESGVHQILVEKEQIRHLKLALQENTLFSKNSHICVPTFSSDLV